VFLHLGARINWHRLFNELIADLDVAELHERQLRTLARSDVPPP